MVHQDDSESKIIQILKFSIKKTYKLDSSQYSIADIIKIHPCNGLHKRKKEHDDESEIVQLVNISVK